MSILDEAIKNAHFTVQWGNHMETISSAGDLAFYLWDRDNVQFDLQPVEVLERNELDSYYDKDGKPLRVVFEVLGKTWIAEGHYDSWEGQHFSSYEVNEAELINKPIWVAKNASN
jgi:hypothetical protein